MSDVTLPFPMPRLDRSLTVVAPAATREGGAHEPRTELHQRYASTPSLIATARPQTTTVTRSA
jgi:hypothetical protein